MTNPMPRREFIERSALAARRDRTASFSRTHDHGANPAGSRRVRARQPRTSRAGEHVLFEENGRRSVLYVPAGYDAKRAAPFALALHGATGSGDSMLRGSRAAADAHGVILLSPSSTGNTWDALHRGYGDDFNRIDRMLKRRLRSLCDRSGASGDTRVLRRRDIRDIRRPDERRPVYARHRTLTRLHHPRGAARTSKNLRLARTPRPDPADRQVRATDRGSAPARRVRTAVR